MATKPKKRTPAWHPAASARARTSKLNAANSSLRSKLPHRRQERREGRPDRRQEKATELFAKMQAVVDTIADKGIFHKNKAARDKSRLSAKVKALAAA